MKWFLLWALGGAGAVLVAACIAFLLARHRFQRYHRVHHKVPTDAPVTWAVDPRQPARLHRRLARIGSAATAIGDDHRPRGRRIGRRPEPSPLTEAADDLCAQAVALDHRLSRLAVLAPPARRQPLVELTAAVTDLEAAAAHLVAISTQVRAPRVLAYDDPDVTAVQGQLQRLAEAHRELDALDATAGLAASHQAPSALPPPPARPAAPQPARPAASTQPAAHRSTR